MIVRMSVERSGEWLRQLRTARTRAGGVEVQSKGHSVKAWVWGWWGVVDCKYFWTITAIAK